MLDRILYWYDDVPRDNSWRSNVLFAYKFVVAMTGMILLLGVVSFVILSLLFAAHGLEVKWVDSIMTILGF